MGDTDAPEEYYIHARHPPLPLKEALATLVNHGRTMKWDNMAQPKRTRSESAKDPTDIMADALEVIYQAGIDVESCDELAHFLKAVEQAKVAYDALLTALESKPVLQSNGEDTQG